MVPHALLEFSRSVLQGTFASVVQKQARLGDHLQTEQVVESSQSNDPEWPHQKKGTSVWNSQTLFPMDQTKLCFWEPSFQANCTKQKVLESQKEFTPSTTTYHGHQKSKENPLPQHLIITVPAVRFARFFVVYIWVFPKIMVPQNGRFIMEIPIKMDDLGVLYHHFRKHPYFPPTRLVEKNLSVWRCLPSSVTVQWTLTSTSHWPWMQFLGGFEWKKHEKTGANQKENVWLASR